VSRLIDRWDVTRKSDDVVIDSATATISRAPELPFVGRLYSQPPVQAGVHVWCVHALVSIEEAFSYLSASVP